MLSGYGRLGLPRYWGNLFCRRLTPPTARGAVTVHPRFVVRCYNSHARTFSSLSYNDTTLERFFDEHKITIEGNVKNLPPPVDSFKSIVVPPSVHTALSQRNFLTPAPIQMVGLPLAIAGRDVIAISPTGSGKTLSFVLPALLHINKKKKQGVSRQENVATPSVLIISPTRELANQTHSELQLLSSVDGTPMITSVPVYGGLSRSAQKTQLLNGVDAIVGCPGRLLDFMQEKVVNLERTTYVVLDEADRMLDMGFERDIRKILRQLPNERQTLMYSATWPSTIAAISDEFCRSDKITIKVGSVELEANKNITQNAILTTEKGKFEHLAQCLKGVMSSRDTGSKTSGSRATPEKVLIFVGRKRRCQVLSEQLHKQGIPSIFLHGNVSQSKRSMAIQAFEEGHQRILIATDIASRGLHISDITSVINYDLPQTVEDYVHRIGRTARAGKKGTSLIYFTPSEYSSSENQVAKRVVQLMAKMGHPPSAEIQRVLKAKSQSAAAA